MAVPPAETPVCEPFLPLLPTKFGEFVRFSKGRKIKNPMWSRIQFIHWIWLQSPYGIRGNMYSLINSIGRALLGLHHFGPTPHLPVCFFHLWFCHFFFETRIIWEFFFFFFPSDIFITATFQRGALLNPCEIGHLPANAHNGADQLQALPPRNGWGDGNYCKQNEKFSVISFFVSFWKKVSSLIAITKKTTFSFIATTC